MTSEDRQQLERLYSMSLNFLARARECCEELNPNNFKAESLLWQAHEGLGQYLEVIRCRLESPWKEALQTTNPTLDPGSVGLSANPMTGKSIDKPISPSNEDVLARMAEAESADLPHIKLKDEVRGEGDVAMEDAAVEAGHVVKTWLAPGHLLIEADPKFEAGYRSRDGEVEALKAALYRTEESSANMYGQVQKLTSKLERMERALEQISRTDVSEDWDVAWLVLWRNNAKSIASQALTDEVKG